jgi:hypothetical protein
MLLKKRKWIEKFVLYFFQNLTKSETICVNKYNIFFFFFLDENCFSEPFQMKIWFHIFRGWRWIRKYPSYYLMDLKWWVFGRGVEWWDNNVESFMVSFWFDIRPFPVRNLFDYFRRKTVEKLYRKVSKNHWILILVWITSWPPLVLTNFFYRNGI